MRTLMFVIKLCVMKAIVVKMVVFPNTPVHTAPRRASLPVAAAWNDTRQCTVFTHILVQQ